MILQNEDWKQMFGSMSTGAATGEEKLNRSLMESATKPKQLPASTAARSSDEHEKTRSRSNTPQCVLCEMTPAGEPNNEKGVEAKPHEKATVQGRKTSK